MLGGAKPSILARHGVQWSNDYPFIAAANSMTVLATAWVTGAAYRLAKDPFELSRTLSVLELAKTAEGFGIRQWNPKTRTVDWDAKNPELHGVDARAFNRG